MIILYYYNNSEIWYYFIINIQPLIQFGQEPEPSQATGMAMVRCILGSSLPLLSSAFRRSNFRRQVPPRRERSSERWNYGRERLSDNFAYMASLFTPLGIFYMPQIYDMGFTSPPKEGVHRIFSPLEIRRLRSGLNPGTWVLKASDTNFCLLL